MVIEIERKFLVRDDSWRQGSLRSARIEQGYFCRTPLMRARIRIFGEKGYITLKSEPGTLTRHEFEYEIPKSEAIEIITRFSIEPIITKIRHKGKRTFGRPDHFGIDDGHHHDHHSERLRGRRC